MEEIRRTLVVLGVSKETTAQEVMQYFGNGAGEVILLYNTEKRRQNHFIGEILPMVHQGWRGGREG